MGRCYRDDATGKYVVDYFDAAGRRHRQQVSSDAREAREMLALLEGQAARDRILDVKPIEELRFPDFAKKFLDHQRIHVKSWKRNVSSIGELAPFFGNVLLTAIDAQTIEKFKQARLQKVEPSTVNRDLQCLTRMFNLAIFWRNAKENPMRYVRKFREKGGRLRYLTFEEYPRLMKALPEHLKWVLEVAVNAGMRQGEFAALLWCDIDFENGFASVNDPKNGEPRKVPLNGDALDALVRWRQGVKSGPVLRDADGQPLPKRTLQWQFKKALHEAGITGFRFHDLRHTCASWMAMAGEDVRKIMEVLGHKDIRMTMRYMHLSPREGKAAVSRLQQFIRTRLKEA
jgi:integrase